MLPRLPERQAAVSGGDWWNQAACKGMDSGLWVPELAGGPSAREAQRICDTCPVQHECLDHALAHETGDDDLLTVWGGYTTPERRNILKGRLCDCGRPLAPEFRENRGKFCRRCAEKKGIKRRTVYDVECDVCGTRFLAYIAHAKRCSPKCASDAQTMRQRVKAGERETLSVDADCTECGKTFTQINRVHVVCSEGCRRDRRRRRAKARNQW